MEQQKTNGLVYLAASLYAFIVGLSFLFGKVALTVADPVDILAHRFTASFLAALVPVVFGWLKLNFSWKDILAILPLALFYPAMFFALQLFGLVYTTSSEAGIINATVPIFTALLAAYFLKEQTNLWQKISILMSVLGVVYIFAMKGAAFELSDVKGTLLLLLSSLSFAGYSVLARPLTKKFKPLELTFIMITIGFLCFNIFALTKHLLFGDINLYFKPLASPIFVLSILYLGVLSSMVTALLSNYALSKIEASKMSVFGNLGTLISMIAGVVFLQEQLYYYHIIGAILIIGGVLGTNFLDKVKVKSH